jgi:hypothetical protein
METFSVGHSDYLGGVGITWVKTPGLPKSSLRLPTNILHKIN